MSEPEIYRRLDQLEQTDRELSSNMNELTLEIRLLVKSTQTMQKTLEVLTDIRQELSVSLADIKDELTLKVLDVKDNQSEVNHKFDKRLDNAEIAIKLAKIVGAGFLLSIIGIASTAIFGN